ncbi:MAG: hypothetical protein Q7T05_07070 [Dehalococcoidia bacterium]|nr:hypothetical protein [Dehalococcoidia bacterium]
MSVDKEVVRVAKLLHTARTSHSMSIGELVYAPKWSDTTAWFREVLYTMSRAVIADREKKVRKRLATQRPEPATASRSFYGTSLRAMSGA